MINLFRARLRLNDSHPRNRAGERSLHAFKRSISRAFIPPHLEGEAGTQALQDARILWRLQQDLGGTEILLQSQIQPNFDWVSLDSDNEGLFRVQPVPRLYQPDLGPSLRNFSLLAVPSTNSTQGEHGRQPRRVLSDPEEKRSWGEAKLASAGLKVHDLRCESLLGPPLKRGLAATPGVLFEGIAEVVDPQACLQAIASGLGPEKAFGFGLLLLDE